MRKHYGRFILDQNSPTGTFYHIYAPSGIGVGHAAWRDVAPGWIVHLPYTSLDADDLTVLAELLADLPKPTKEP